MRERHFQLVEPTTPIFPNLHQKVDLFPLRHELGLDARPALDDGKRIRLLHDPDMEGAPIEAVGGVDGADDDVVGGGDGGEAGSVEEEGAGSGAAESFRGGGDGVELNAGDALGEAVGALGGDGAGEDGVGAGDGVEEVEELRGGGGAGNVGDKDGGLQLPRRHAGAGERRVAHHSQPATVKGFMLAGWYLVLRQLDKYKTYMYIRINFDRRCSRTFNSTHTWKNNKIHNLCSTNDVSPELELR